MKELDQMMYYGSYDMGEEKERDIPHNHLSIYIYKNNSSCGFGKDHPYTLSIQRKKRGGKKEEKDVSPEKERDITRSGKGT
jgi:hypothetical protein